MAGSIYRLSIVQDNPESKLTCIEIIEFLSKYYLDVFYIYYIL